MTNAQIILNESVELMKQGIIGSTGRKFKFEYEKDGQKVTEIIDEPEPIHTFATWKALGFKVKKGEKSIAQFVIWKCKPVTVELNGKDENGNDTTIEQETNKMFTKTAYFFKPSQVEPITE